MFLKIISCIYVSIMRIILRDSVFLEFRCALNTCASKQEALGARFWVER